MHSMPRARFHALAVLLLTALLLLAAPAALAKPGKSQGKAHEAPSAAVTEDNDTNDGDTPNNVADDGDNRHPSGKDKSVEAGGSGNQGNSTSDPDDDGRGPDRSNGGADKPDGPGGVDLADQDGNNGCGNDDDFEDDNEGWCGANPKRGGPDVEGTDEEPTAPEDESACAPSHDGSCSDDDDADEAPCGVPTDDCLDGDEGTCDETVNADCIDSGEGTCDETVNSDCTHDEDDVTVGESDGSTDGDVAEDVATDVDEDVVDEGALDTASGNVVLGVFEVADDSVGGVLAAGGGLAAAGLGGAAAAGAGALAAGTLAATGVPLIVLGALALGGIGLGAGLLRRSKRP